MLIGFDKLTQSFEHGRPKGVIHVGAHGAEELESYVQNDIPTVIWVEANPMLAQGLLNKTFPHVGSSVHFFAAHETDGLFLRLNVANNGESSSLLEFGTHEKEHPHVKFVGSIEVPTLTIDTLMERKGFDRTRFDFANIDVQGAELLVLKGMKVQLKHLNYVYLEVNEKSLYKDCALIGELDDYLRHYGFERKLTEMTQHGWGDAFYVKVR